MKIRMRRAIATGAAAMAVAVCAMRIVADYREGVDFQPFGGDRELQSNQVLFPDSEASPELAGEKKNDSSFWERDESDYESTRLGQSSGYLFGRDETMNGGLPTGSLIQTGDNATAAGTLPAGDIYEVIGRPGDADIILPGGGDISGVIPSDGKDDTSSDGSGDNGNNGGHNGNGNNSGGFLPGGNDSNNGGGSGDSGNGSGGTVTPTPGPTVIGTEPTPGYGSASKDAEDNKIIPPKDDWSASHEFSEANLPDGPMEPVFNQGSFGSAQIYRGQKDMDERSIFNLLETSFRDLDTFDKYVLDGTALGKYVRIDAIAFDDGEKIYASDFPVTIPDNADIMKIYMSYRFHQADTEWTQYIYEGYDENWDWVTRDYVRYELSSARVMVLKEILESEGQTITSDMMLNQYGQYLGSGENAYLNLLGYQNQLLGGAGTRLDSLFPGWKEDGVLVSPIYRPEAGRHVLEPGAKVSLSSDYQVEIESFWMKPDYSLQAAGEATTRANNVFLQTLTAYLGEKSYDKYGDEWIERLTVPQYIQAVELEYYPGLAVDNIELPSSVVYISTNGMPSVEDDWLLYNRGLRVLKGYSVEAGNPRYTSENGILYNIDKTEMLGVPTELDTLTVGSDITKVVLPYQTQLEDLILDIEDIGSLPDINYEHLHRSCRIIVPDELLEDYLDAEKDMLKSTGLTVYPASQLDQGYVLRGDFLIDQNGELQRIKRNSVHWLSLPDYVSGISRASMDEFSEELSIVILPLSGDATEFEEGCFDSFEKVTLACYSQEQYDAALELFGESGNVRLRMVTARDDGYTYLETDSGVVLIAAPSGIEEFRGVIPGENGGDDITVAVIGDSVFESSISLKWVILPQETKAIGYEAFKDCPNLEGIFIDSRDNFLLSYGFADNCTKLRFVASNSPGMILEDPGFKLPSNDVWGRYSFLICTPYFNEDSQYNGNWCYIAYAEDGDIDGYKMVDIGGTYALYGGNWQEDGNLDEWLLIRAGSTVDGEVILPETTEAIYQEAFENTRTTDDSIMTVNWEDLDMLGIIGRLGFAGSDIGVDIVLPDDIRLDDYAFKGCGKLTGVTLQGSSPADGIIVEEEVFGNCTALKKVSFGYMNINACIYPSLFSGCTSLEEIEFLSKQPPQLIPFSPGSVFYFNYDAETSGTLKIVVPEGLEESYVRAWHYNINGYAASETQSAYQVMYDALENEMTGYDFETGTWIEPTYEEVLAAVEQKVLEGENRIRRLMGLPEQDEISQAYNYVIDSNGFITLVSAKNIGEYTGLTPIELEMPDQWTLDYIGEAAFRYNPELRWIDIPDTLVGIYHNAFDGLEFDEEDETDGLNLIVEGSIFGLRLKEEGVPFSFGIDDSRVSITVMDILNGYDDESLYVDLWTLPMAGYYDIESMEAAVRAELGEGADDEEVREVMSERLLEAENRVRRLLFGVDETEKLTFSFSLSTDAPSLPEIPVLPELPEMPDGGDDTENGLPETGDAEDGGTDPGDAGETEDTEDTSDADGGDDNEDDTDGSDPDDGESGREEEVSE